MTQEQKYCDRNICIKNEYNSIGCDECEVTKSQILKKDLGVDCISREQTLEPYKILENTDTLSVYTIRQNLAELPSVTPQEPKTGHWITKIKSDLRGDMWPTNPKCSECGGEPYYSNTIYNYKFCPNCGAKMVEPQAESEG